MNTLVKIRESLLTRQELGGAGLVSKSGYPTTKDDARVREPALCEICKELKELAYTDPVGREYCVSCFSVLPIPTATRILGHLMMTIPFRIGDTVECRTAGALFDGIGVIDDISIELEHFGTPTYPSFRVHITDKAYPECPDYVWYMESQLRRISEDNGTRKVDDMAIKKYGDDIRRGNEDNDETSQASSEPTGQPGNDWNDTPDLPEQ